MIETVVAAFVAFFVGSYLGVTAQKEREGQPPSGWQAIRHQELLRECGLMCGERRLATYDSVYGKCTCEEGK